MKFLANENVPVASVNYLKSHGFDILAIGLDDHGTSDKHVVKLAIDQDRTIITYDSDYGELIFKRGLQPDAGVIFIRNQPTKPLDTANIIEKLTSNPDLTSERTLTVIYSGSVRQRKY